MSTHGHFASKANFVRLSSAFKLHLPPNSAASQRFTNCLSSSSAKSQELPKRTQVAIVTPSDVEPVLAHRKRPQNRACIRPTRSTSPQS